MFGENFGRDNGVSVLFAALAWRSPLHSLPNAHRAPRSRPGRFFCAAECETCWSSTWVAARALANLALHLIENQEFAYC
jgi:hypothetical protein